MTQRQLAQWQLAQTERMHDLEKAVQAVDAKVDVAVSAAEAASKGVDRLFWRLLGALAIGMLSIVVVIYKAELQKWLAG